MEYLLDRVKELIGPLFSDGQFDLVEISFRRESGRMILRLLADRPIGGITLGECASLNRKISEILDTADLIQEDFALE
ncbi:MAG: ribosome maturation factor RimP, partial [Candidatus Omnitrophota bacterium]|nr:ribosome maturation factor RimP [Candidatus Omnitrophota bacterium]